jgi:ribosome biogenesis GTPase
MAIPVVVLTKADLCEDINTKLAEVDQVSIGADVVVCSALNGYGYNEVLAHINAGQTIAFIGSSGVGKSTLINKLMGEDILDTNEIRNDGKGRHTTTHRQLAAQ